MNTIDHDATDDEIVEALLVNHIGPALDELGIVPYEGPDPKPNELLAVYDEHNKIYVRVTLTVIRG